MISIDYNKNVKNQEWDSLGFVCGHNVPEMKDARKVHDVAKRMNQELIHIRINHGDAPSEHFNVLVDNFFDFIMEEVHIKLLESSCGV